MAQESTRWTIFRQNQLSHNLVTIGGRRLKVDAKADIRVLETGEVTRVAVDLSDIYGREVVSAAERAFALDRRTSAVTVRDALKGVKPGEPVRWAMTTKAEKAEIDGCRAVLSIGEKRLSVTMNSSTPGRWEFADLSKGRNEWDSPNPGCSQHRWETAASREGAVSLETCFR